MSWLGSIYRHAQTLGAVANNVGSVLGSVQQMAKRGIQGASDVVSSIGQTVSDNSGALDEVGMGGVGRYVGAGLSSGGALGHSVGNLVGSQSLGDAIRNGVDVYKKGLSFAGDVTNTGRLYSPISRN